MIVRSWSSCYLFRCLPRVKSKNLDTKTWNKSRDQKMRHLLIFSTSLFGFRGFPSFSLLLFHVSVHEVLPWSTGRRDTTAPGATWRSTTHSHHGDAGGGDESPPLPFSHFACLLEFQRSRWNHSCDTSHGGFMMMKGMRMTKMRMIKDL